MNTGHRFAADSFSGDFDALPLRAHVLFGAVPLYPVAGDFEHAVSIAFGSNDAAAEWRVEAVRWRAWNGGKTLDLKEIARATAKRLYKKAVES